MNDAPATRLSLLVRLCDARDDGAWSQFVDIYAPLVYGYARKHGLQDADAADLTQDVLQAVSGAIRRPFRPASIASENCQGWPIWNGRKRIFDFLQNRTETVRVTEEFIPGLLRKHPQNK